MEKLRLIFKEFIGTKNYHNYTKKGNPNDKANKRHILSIECEEYNTDYLYESDPSKNPGIPLVKITLVGQSFIYNQIRKMVGMMV